MPTSTSDSQTTSLISTVLVTVGLQSGLLTLYLGFFGFALWYTSRGKGTFAKIQTGVSVFMQVVFKFFDTVLQLIQLFISFIMIIAHFVLWSMYNTVFIMKSVDVTYNSDIFGSVGLLPFSAQ
jgi:hypothetical protein